MDQFLVILRDNADSLLIFLFFPDLSMGPPIQVVVSLPFSRSMSPGSAPGAHLPDAPYKGKRPRRGASRSEAGPQGEESSQ